MCASPARAESCRHRRWRGRGPCSKCRQACTQENAFFFVDMGILCSDPLEVASGEDGRSMLLGLQVQQLLAGSLVYRFSHFPPPSHKQLVRLSL